MGAGNADALGVTGLATGPSPRHRRGRAKGCRSHLPLTLPRRRNCSALSPGLGEISGECKPRPVGSPPWTHHEGKAARSREHAPDPRERAILQVEEALDVEIADEELFDVDTVRDLVRTVTRASATGTSLSDSA